MREDELRRLLLEEVETMRREGDEPVVEGYRPTALLSRVLDPQRQWAAPDPAAQEPDQDGPSPNTGERATQLISGPLSAGEVRKLGRYELVTLLGEGGMGTVYEAKDLELNRTVAIKLIKESAKIDRDRLLRFVVEAKVTGDLQHPNIVPVHDLGISLDGILYFVMKKVQGRSLANVIESLRLGMGTVRQDWSRRRLLTVFIQICQAVAYAHAREVLHRDLKPGNIMLGPFGEVFVMDWGAAGLLRGPHSLSSINLGTPGYVSPERLQGTEPQDKRSDVWSLGSMLYEVLTWQPAYPGSSAEELLRQTQTGPPTDPRERAPDKHVPDEIAEICRTAMARDPAQRFASSADLAGAVEDFLEGSRRRARVAKHLAQANRNWSEYMTRCQEFEAKIERQRELARPIPPWAPAEEKKALWTLRESLNELRSDLAAAFAMVVAAGERALAEESDNPQAKEFLARAYWSRFEEAEKRGDASQQRFYEGRVRAYDGGHYAEALAGVGALTLNTDPRDAEVLCQRVHQRGLIWSLEEPVSLGFTPLLEVPLRMGSYLLTLRSPGKRDTLYPVYISRRRHWDSGERPVRLYNEETLGKGLIYVPPGPFVYGGDPELPETMPPWDTWQDGFFIAEFPVTVEEYLEFINALRQEDPDLAWERVPRRTSSEDDFDGQYWDRPRSGENYELPTEERGGHRWQPREPIGNISWYDAQAYAEWASARDGVRYGVPREREWEKAARGVDGRLFPWGNEFDPTLCRMRDSRPDPPQAEPVGTFVHDVSIYGVRDTAGSAREWCGDEDFDGKGNLRPARGGAWILDSRGCRLAFRNQTEGWKAVPSLGFRLVMREM